MSGILDLLPYAVTDKQKTLLHTIDAVGTNAAAAKQLNINIRTVTRTLEKIKSRAAAQGFSVEGNLNNPVAAGFAYHGYSTLTKDANGDTIWLKASRDKALQKEAFNEFIEGLASSIKGEAKPVKTPKGKFDPDLLSLIIFGDAHLGMYAWGEETLERDFNTDIACQEIRDAIDNLIDRSPPAETGVLVDVGDFMHANDPKNTTAAGTIVDTDSRHSRVLRAAGMVMRYCIDKMLTKYKKVIVVVAKGNHNPEPAVAVSLMLSFYYDREKRVEVLDTIGHHHYLEFGDWLLGVNHGDKVKPQKLVAMMARDHKGWSAAKHRMWIIGHIHHERALEIDGCVVRSFNTLAPSDAWHASMGYKSKSQATLMTLHRTKGRHSTLEYDLPDLGAQEAEKASHVIP